MNSKSKENRFKIIIGSKKYFNSLDLGEILLPEKMTLNQNYPNPFNPLTQVTYSINRPAQVKVEIFNVLGKKMATLVNSYLQPGSYTRVWNAQDYGSGIYFIKMSAGNFIEIKRAVLLK